MKTYTLRDTINEPIENGPRYLIKVYDCTDSKMELKRELKETAKVVEDSSYNYLSFNYKNGDSHIYDNTNYQNGDKIPLDFSKMLSVEVFISDPAVKWVQAESYCFTQAEVTKQIKEYCEMYKITPQEIEAAKIN